MRRQRPFSASTDKHGPVKSLDSGKGTHIRISGCAGHRSPAAAHLSQAFDYPVLLSILRLQILSLESLLEGGKQSRKTVINDCNPGFKSYNLRYNLGSLNFCDSAALPGK